MCTLHSHNTEQAFSSSGNFPSDDISSLLPSPYSSLLVLPLTIPCYQHANDKRMKMFQPKEIFWWHFESNNNCTLEYKKSTFFEPLHLYLIRFTAKKSNKLDPNFVELGYRGSDWCTLHTILITICLWVGHVGLCFCHKFKQFINKTC